MLTWHEACRRRFHGAFTGGFSAGYYNSVGSKEGEACDCRRTGAEAEADTTATASTGWTPSTFKSSRSQRASQQNQSVADAAKAFMDEEVRTLQSCS